MSQPVKLSDELVLDARLAADALERSLAKQVELWAKLGRAVELALDIPSVIALRRAGTARPLSECLESVDSPEGHKRFHDLMASEPWPHYEAHPKKRGLLIRVDATGKRTVGRFVNREFRQVAGEPRIRLSVKAGKATERLSVRKRAVSTS